MPLGPFAVAVGDPDVPLSVDVDAMWGAEHSSAKALEELA
jgi:hypothetical protein